MVRCELCIPVTFSRGVRKRIMYCCVCCVEMESAHNTLADTGDYMSVSKHLTGEVQGRLSYGSCSKVLPTWST